MQNSLLWECFQKLSKSELREFRQFVKSPYFNQREDVIQLFDYLEKAVKIPSTSIKKEYVFKTLFPKQTYSDQAVRYIMSFLMNLLKKYIIQQSLEIGGWNNLLLLQTARKKGWNRFFLKEAKSIEKKRQVSALQNEMYYLMEYLHQKELWHFDAQHNRQSEKYLDKLSIELGTFFKLELLKQACSNITNKLFANQELKLPLLNEVLKQIESAPTEEVLTVQAYFYALKSLTLPEDENHYHHLKTLIQNYENDFPISELQNIYTLAINYCVRKWNSGNEIYKVELLNWYKAGLEINLFLDHGYISRFYYRNIFTVGLLNKEIEWAKAFLEDYKSYLHPSFRNNTYYFNLINYYFRLERYEKALELLRSIEFKDALYNLDTRRMLLRIYYELKEIDALESLLDSFSTYIHRLKQIGYHRELYLNLIKYTRKLLAIIPRNKQAIEDLKNKIQAESKLAERAWLLQKLEEME